MIWIVCARFDSDSGKNKDIAGIFDRLCHEKKKAASSDRLRIDEVKSKKELSDCIEEIRKQGLKINEWHFTGFGIPYGPLMGSPAWPEELSVSEWNMLKIPFEDKAKAWFYMENSGLWLAPFLASLYGITCFGCPGLLLNGFSGMRAFSPEEWKEPADYNPVASLYAEAFSDITVRRDECRWIRKRILEKGHPKVLDIGCGNGALLKYLASVIKEGTGVDVSSAAIKIAVENYKGVNNLFFTTVNGPGLPFSDNSFDVVVSMLSFRYLDWDPVISEMKRVLRPGGRILIVDMVESRVWLHELPFLLFDKMKNLLYSRKHKNFKKSLTKLVNHPDWKKMVSRNPMHLKIEFSWYLKSRFPRGTIEVLNTGGRAKILAFNSNYFK